MTDTLALVTDLQAGFFVARQRSIPCSASAVLSALKFVLNCVYVGGSARSLPCTSLAMRLARTPRLFNGVDPSLRVAQ